jgi:riboflavin synthase
VNGVSLTVNSIASDIFSINLIPHTLENTTLQSLNSGHQVNLEVDQIARYVERMTLWEREKPENPEGSNNPDKSKNKEQNHHD